MGSSLPLSDNIITKLKARRQAVRYTCVLREVREFRAYCCNIDSDGIMGVAKEPVPFLNITPNPICLGAAISWDISNSYAPGSTLTDWEVDFGDSSSASGSDFPNDTTSGTHTYAAIGTYDIVATITEGTGRIQTVTYQLEVVECGEIGIFPDTFVWTYMSLEGGGVYFIDWNADSPDWEGRNLGLEGNALLVRDLEIHPNTKHLTDANHELWIATKDGVYNSIDGGRHWAKLTMGDPDNSYFYISPDPTEEELDWHKIVFHPINENIVFAVASGYFYG